MKRALCGLSMLLAVFAGGHVLAGGETTKTCPKGTAAKVVTYCLTRYAPDGTTEVCCWTQIECVPAVKDGSGGN